MLVNTTCRALLAFVAIGASFSLVVAYCAEAAAHKDIVPLAATAPLWLLSIICWFGFIVGGCTATVIATLTAHLDRLFLDMRDELRTESDRIIDALGGDDDDRRTIDNHLAAHLAAADRTSAPTQRRGANLGVVN